jgi:hypothetical protein
MYVFSSPWHAAREGFDVIDYDVERQLFVVEKGQQAFFMRARHDGCTTLISD